MTVERAFNLADLFEIVADAVPERECLVCSSGPRLSYRDVDRRTTALAHWLSRQGIGAGDRVALCLSNGVEYLEGMIAAFKLRAVPVNVNYRYTEEELGYVLIDAGVRAIVLHDRFAGRLAAARGAAGGPDVFVSVPDGEGDPEALRALGAVAYDDALATPGERDFGPRSPDDLYLLYTGGTTGMPKGVMWRQEDIFFAALGGGNPGGDPVASPEELAQGARHGSRTRSLPASPLMHGTAHWMAFAALFMGGTVVLSPDRHYDPDALLRLIAAEHVTFLTIVGDAFARPLVDAIDRLPAGSDLSSLRVILSGGAILSAAVKLALVDRLPGTVVVDGYGSSESGGQGQGVTVAGSTVTGSRFRVNDDTAVLGDDLHPVPPGTIGRLARRGRVPLGYFNDPELTARTFPVVDGVRWSVPGDYAVAEPDGTVTLLGRGSVSINTGGEKVFPEEVEGILKSHPAVFDVVVVGVADEQWGQRVVAVVEPVAGSAGLTLEGLRSHARPHLAGYKLPRELVMVERVQRTASGKADYRWARDTAASRR